MTLDGRRRYALTCMSSCPLDDAMNAIDRWLEEDPFARAVKSILDGASDDLDAITRLQAAQAALFAAEPESPDHQGAEIVSVAGARDAAARELHRVIRALAAA